MRHLHQIRSHCRSALVAVMVAGALLLAQPDGLAQDRPPVPADSTGADSLAAIRADSTAPRRPPIHLMGSVERTLPPDAVVSDSAIRFTLYRNAGDILATTPGMFLQEFGARGAWDQLYADGLAPNSIHVGFDGVPMNDAWSGTLDLNLIPTEQLDRIEVIRGATSFAYGLNASGGFINFVSKTRRALKPVSRIRYSESAYGDAFIDGMLSQDVIRGLNVTAGAHHTTFGGRFLNNGYDQWNGRVKVRYNVSKALNLVASENYNQTELRLFGGLALTSVDSFLTDPRAGRIVNGGAYEKVTRHDLLLQASFLPTGDTAGITTASLFYSSQLREYRDRESPFEPFGAGIRDDQNGRHSGFRVDHQQMIGSQSVTIGGEIQVLRTSDSVKPTSRALFGVATLRYPDSDRPVTIRLSGRLDSYRSQTTAGFGADFSIVHYGVLKLSSGLSRSFRFPTNFEMAGNSFIAPLAGEHPERHWLVEGGASLDLNPTFRLDARIFYRSVRQFIALEQTGTGPSTYRYVRHNEHTVGGLSLTQSLQIWYFLLEGRAEFLSVDDSNDSRRTLPEWRLDGGLYVRGKLADGHFDVKAGARVRSFGPFLGQEFNTEYLLYLPGGEEAAILRSSVLDLVLLGHLGNAQIHIVLQNLLDQKYTLNTYYPMVDRTLRFGVTWEFLN